MGNRLVGVWYINLDRRPDKRLVMEAVLNAMGWGSSMVHRFSGRDGAAFDSIDDMVDAAVEEGFDSFERLRVMESRGRLGCIWSWCVVFRELMDLGEGDCVLLMVDDVVCRREMSVVKSLVQGLPGLKILQMFSWTPKWVPFFAKGCEPPVLEKFNEDVYCGLRGAGDVGLVLTAAGAELLLSWMLEWPRRYPEMQVYMRSWEENEGCYSVVDSFKWMGFVDDSVFELGSDRLLM